jgi:hypothetical protein
VSEILGLFRMKIGPQTNPRFHRGAFSGSVDLSVTGGLFILILFVVPRQTGLQLVEANVLAARLKENFADKPPIVVPLALAL